MKNHMRQSSRLWDYQVLDELGRGEYGQVFKVKNKKDGQFYALKKVNIVSCHQKQKIQAFREIKALKLIKHPDIIQYYESFLSMDNIYIVMEYAAKGDFAKLVRQRKQKQKPFSQQELWEIFTTLTNALKYLHEMGIIHRDLKLQNIFLTDQGKVKVGDLGMCKVVQQSNQLISTRVGTPVYFAPQIIQHQLYSYPVDVWALGCVFYYLCMLQHPYKQATMQTLPYFVIDKDPKPIKGQYGGYLINLINDMLNKNPKSRPTIFDINLLIKNRENPNPANRVRVFDFKKLLMMKPDLQKLQKMKKNYQRFNNEQKKQSDSPNKNRYYSTSEIKTYRDYLKLNLSSQKLNSVQQSDPESFEVAKNKLNNKKQKAKHINLSVIIPTKKISQKNNEPFSPIKTNGFRDNKVVESGREPLSANLVAETNRIGRNYAAFRQARKSVMN